MNLPTTPTPGARCDCGAADQASTGTCDGGGHTGDVEFVEVARRRRMMRRYDPGRPVGADVVDELVGLARRAPSAGFSQGWQFLVLDDAADLDRFWAVTTTPGRPADAWLNGMRTAPVLIVALSDKEAYLDRYAEADKGWTDRDEARWPVPYWDVDTGMAALMMLLGAVDRGLGACLFGVPPEFHDATRAEFAIPPELNFVGVVSVGHPVPGDRPAARSRRHRAGVEVVSFGRFGARHRVVSDDAGGGSGNGGGRTADEDGNSDRVSADR